MLRWLLGPSLPLRAADPGPSIALCGPPGLVLATGALAAVTNGAPRPPGPIVVCRAAATDTLIDLDQICLGHARVREHAGQRVSVFMIALKMYGDAFHPNGSALHW